MKTNTIKEALKQTETGRNILWTRGELRQLKGRSAGANGVLQYTHDLLDDYEELAEYAIDNGNDPPELTERVLLNGATDWQEYSEGGSSLIYNCDIAERLCTPSELKRTRGGELRPNSREIWLDVQARALYQAADLLLKTAKITNMFVDHEKLMLRWREALERLEPDSPPEIEAEFRAIDKKTDEEIEAINAYRKAIYARYKFNE